MVVLIVIVFVTVIVNDFVRCFAIATSCIVIVDLTTTAIDLLLLLLLALLLPMSLPLFMILFVLLLWLLLSLLFTCIVILLGFALCAAIAL